MSTDRTKSVKPIVCFKGLGEFNAGVTAHQHSGLGAICVLTFGEGATRMEGDRLLRLPAAKAIELGNLMIQKGQLAMTGGSDT